MEYGEDALGPGSVADTVSVGSVVVAEAGDAHSGFEVLRIARVEEVRMIAVFGRT